MAAEYESGATVYELATGFGCNRTTVPERLKKAGVAMRLKSPSIEVVDEMLNLYQSGMSLQKVGEHIGFSSGTVTNYLKERNIPTRGNHGRRPSPQSPADG